MGADAEVGQRVHTVAVDVDAGVGRRDALEQTEEDRGARDAQRFPVAEDHDGQREEAEARHVAVGGAVGGGQRIDKAAESR